MNQLRLANVFEQSTKRTRRQAFREEMLVRPTGRPPYPVLVLLQVHFLQKWFALADEAALEALHDIAVYRAFAGIDPGATGIPDATIILRFRLLFERHDLAVALLHEVVTVHGGQLGTRTR